MGEQMRIAARLRESVAGDIGEMPLRDASDLVYEASRYMPRPFAVVAGVGLLDSLRAYVREASIRIEVMEAAE